MSDVSLMDFLNQLNRKNYSFYERLSDENKKQMVPLLLSRWQSGTDDIAQVLLTNEFVNNVTFSLHKHPNLLWKLLCATNSGINRRYKYPKRAKKSSSMTLTLIKKYFDYSHTQAVEVLPLLTVDSLVLMAEQLGYETTDITKIKKELK